MTESYLLSKYGPNRIYGRVQFADGKLRLISLWDWVLSQYGKTLIKDTT